MSETSHFGVRVGIRIGKKSYLGRRILMIVMIIMMTERRRHIVALIKSKAGDQSVQMERYCLGRKGGNKDPQWIMVLLPT